MLAPDIWELRVITLSLSFNSLYPAPILGLFRPSSGTMVSRLFYIVFFLASAICMSLIFESSLSKSCSCLMKPMLGHTIDLFDLVKFNASQKPIPFSFIRYAITQLELLDTPAKL